MDLHSLTRPLTGPGRVSAMISAPDLAAWAAAHSLSPREAIRAALAAGLFPECFARNFPVFSPADQLRLWEACALVAGLGGLGGSQALLLARAGVGRLLVADGDVFTPSNLNRQTLADHSALGHNKAQVAARRLLAINPALRVESIPEFLGPHNLPIYVPQANIILDALDSAAARQHLFAAAVQAGVPLVHGAVAETFGQVTTLLPGDPPLTATLWPPAAALDTAPGVLAPIVSLIASLQVQEALRLLIGRPPCYHRRLAHFDGDTGRLEIIPLEEVR